MAKEKPKKGYSVNFNILEKDLPKMKKIMKKNMGDILVRGVWTENKILMI